MNRSEFLDKLKKGLSGLSQEEISEHLSFYGEMIDDRIEEGLTEEEAIAGIGNAEEIAFQIMQEHGHGISNIKTKPSRKLTALEIVLLVLGSPIWASLLIAFFSVVLSLYIILWSVIVSFWAVAVSFMGVALGGFITAGVFLFQGNALQGIAMLGFGIFFVGLFILGIIGCVWATNGSAFLTKRSVLFLISVFKTKENKR